MDTKFNPKLCDHGAEYCGATEWNYCENCDPVRSRAENIATCAKAFVYQLNVMTDEERVIVFYAINEMFCRHCGKADPDCQCWNDE